MQKEQYIGNNFPYNILFESWVVNSSTGNLVACACVFIVAIAYEVFKFSKKFINLFLFSNESEGYHHIKDTKFIFTSIKMKWTVGLLFTLLTVFEKFIMYLLMLCVMTFNIYLLLSICFGSGVGYLVVQITYNILVEKSNNKINEENNLLSLQIENNIQCLGHSTNMENVLIN